MWKRNADGTYVNDDAQFTGIVIQRWWKGRFAVVVNGSPLFTARTLMGAKFHATHEAGIRHSASNFTGHGAGIKGT